jgi:hypothetical protein
MTVQPTFGFAKLRRDVAADDADRQPGETASDGEKNRYPGADRTPSVSSISSDEKQTFGVSKVEAITTVWTKSALITLYVLYCTPLICGADLKYLPCLFCQFDAAADHRTIFAVRHKRFQLPFTHPCHRDCIQHYNRCHETASRENSRRFWPV